MTDYHLMLITPSDDPNITVEFRVLEEIGPDDYTRYIEAHKQICRALDGGLLQYVEQSSDFVAQAARDFERAIRDESSVPRAMALASSWGRVFACLVLTFCSSLNLHQEQRLAEVKRRFGKGSPEAERVKIAFNKCYDDSVHYRLAYAVRNAMVHYTLELVTIRVHKNVNRSPAGLFLPDLTNYQVLLDHKSMLKWDGLKAAIRDELSRLDDEIDLIRLVEGSRHSVERVHRRTDEIIRPFLTRHAEALCELDARFGSTDNGADHALLAREPDADGTRSFPHTVVRPDALALARSLLATPG